MDWNWGPPHTWNRTKDFLERLSETLPEKPKALLVVSGHWEEPAFTVSTASQPSLIFDYSGFPEHTYRLTWPAPGDPELAARVADLLRSAGLLSSTDATRGYDHGVFIPLKVAFPLAEIPVVTLSLVHTLDPALHIVAGSALAPLRDEGVLIIASGMSWHNLRAYMQLGTLDCSRQFDHWLTAVVESPSAEREIALAKWQDAPFARHAHPREEHLLPLMVAAGAAGADYGKCVFTDAPMQAVNSAYRFG